MRFNPPVWHLCGYKKNRLAVHDATCYKCGRIRGNPFRLGNCPDCVLSRMRVLRHPCRIMLTAFRGALIIGKEDACTRRSR